MSDTPRTDAVLRESDGFLRTAGALQDLCRQLERELAEAQKALDRCDFPACEQRAMAPFHDGEGAGTFLGPCSCADEGRCKHNDQGPLCMQESSPSAERAFPICKDHTASDWNQPTLDDDSCVLCRLFYLEAQEGLLEEWQQRAKRAEDAIAEIKRPLDEQMARLNATVTRLNEENERLRKAPSAKEQSGDVLSALIALEQAYSNKHSPRHRAACLAQAQVAINRATESGK